MSMGPPSLKSLRKCSRATSGRHSFSISITFVIRSISSRLKRARLRALNSRSAASRRNSVRKLSCQRANKHLLEGTSTRRSVSRSLMSRHRRSKCEKSSMTSSSRMLSSIISSVRTFRLLSRMCRHAPYQSSCLKIVAFQCSVGHQSHNMSKLSICTIQFLCTLKY